MKQSLLFALALVACVVLARAAEPDHRPQVEFTQPFSVVGVPSGANETHKALAKEVADAIGVQLIIESATNPTCCVWLEITGWTPNPGDAGWIIVNQGGGSIISASNIEQLRAAVSRFKKSIRKNDRHVEVPVGLLTSYPVISAAD